VFMLKHTSCSYSSNILLNNNMQAKLGDFGFARPLPKRAGGRSFAVTNECCGTEGFIAPEFYRGEIGPKVDVFAFGIVSQHKMYMYDCVHVYVHVHVCIHVYMYIYISTYIYTLVLYS